MVRKTYSVSAVHNSYAKERKYQYQAVDELDHRSSEARFVQKPTSRRPCRTQQVLLIAHHWILRNIVLLEVDLDQQNNDVTKRQIHFPKEASHSIVGYKRSLMSTNELVDITGALLRLAKPPVYTAKHAKPKYNLSKSIRYHKIGVFTMYYETDIYEINH